MRAIVDSNLPVTLVKRVRTLNANVAIEHIRDSGMADASDGLIRRKWAEESLIWITRDEDFWIECPSKWAVVWISLHNPSLAFLRDVVAPAMAAALDGLKPGSRLLVGEDGIIRL